MKNKPLFLFFLLVIFYGCSPSLRTVQETNDQELLAKIAINNKDFLYGDKINIRSAAIARLTDQVLLAKIAVEGDESSWPVRCNAIARLTDQTLLTKIALEDKTRFSRGCAIGRLTDQTLLSKIALEDKEARSYANQRIAELYTMNVKRLTDQTQLAKIALEENNITIRRAAVDRLTDQNVLAKIVLEDENDDIRKAATERLSDQTLLAKIVEASHKGEEIYLPALARITDPVLIKKFSSSDEDAIRELAKLKLALIDAELIKRTGLLKIRYRNEMHTKRYEPGDPTRLFRTCREEIKFIEIINDTGKAMNEFRFVSDKCKVSESFLNSESVKTYYAKIDFPLIYSFLGLAK